jgi:hypothetical protein
MKTTEEKIKIMQHYADGGKVEYNQGLGWKIATKPCWSWRNTDYRIAEEKPEPINWLKTGWVKSKKTNIKYMIIKYNEHHHCPYYLDNIWYPEKEMIEQFDPCESPIGK